MKIGMIGAGHIGATLAGLLATVGHEVALSNSTWSRHVRKSSRRPQQKCAKQF